MFLNYLLEVGVGSAHILLTQVKWSVVVHKQDKTNFLAAFCFFSPFLEQNPSISMYHWFCDIVIFAALCAERCFALRVLWNKRHIFAVPVPFLSCTIGTVHHPPHGSSKIHFESNNTYNSYNNAAPYSRDNILAHNYKSISGGNLAGVGKGIGFLRSGCWTNGPW